MSNNKMTPRLRFPEFRNDGNWKNAPLSVLCDRIIEKVGEVQLTPVSITAGRGYVSQAEKFGRDISGAQYKNYIYLRRGDFAYNKGNSNLYPQGCVYRLKEFDQAAASNAFICFKLRDGNSSGFFEGLFEKNTHGRQLVRFLTSGARSDGLLNIKAEEFFSVQFPLPPRSAEQQKIADCLSSLDELIAAEGRKLESLRAYKKGLMQQLFPRAGETTPQLRFPEFRDKEGWKEVTLANICQIQRGKFTHRPRNDPRFFNGPYPFIQTGDVVRANGGSVVASQSLNELGLTVSKLFKPTIVLVTIAANIGDTAILDREACFTDSVVGLIPVSDRVSPRFLESVVRLKKEELIKTATKAAQMNINNEILSNLVLLIPPLDEQIQIEGCLSSLNTTISAQSEKLAALRMHKKGLMQKLFPSAAEDEE